MQTEDFTAQKAAVYEAGSRQPHKGTLFIVFKVLSDGTAAAVATCNIACSSLKRISFSALGAFNAGFHVEPNMLMKC